MNHLTLIIPTRGRPAAFGRLLNSLERQTLPHRRWNVLFISDGTPAHALPELRRAVASLDADARLIERPPAGPAAARNAGLAEARGDVVLFLNSDVELHPRHLARHAEFHHRHPQETRAAHGEVRWPRRVLQGSHMHALAERTFRYDRLYGDREQVWVFFCTASLSVKRSLLADARFDESFPEPCFEDTELGYRLQQSHGLRVDVLRGGPVLHWHYHTRRAFLRRAAMNGRNAVRILQRIPEFHERLVRVWQDPPPRRRAQRAARLFASGRSVDAWLELETAAMMRAYWQAVGD